EDGEQDAVQSIEILLHAEAEASQRQDRVDGELAGQVQEAAAAAVDPAHPPAPHLQLLALEQDMRVTPLPADAEEGRVLADDEGGAVRPVGDLLDEVA